MNRSKIATSPALRATCVALASLIAAPAMAQAVGDWRHVPTATTLPSLNGFSLGEFRDGGLLLLGGHVGAPGATDWRWDGIDWTPISTAPMPSRNNAAMAQYGALGPAGVSSLIIFGGDLGASPLTDTWTTLNGVTWQAIGTGGPSLTKTSMAGDRANNRMVMVGKNIQGQFTTWFFDMIVVQGWVAGPTFVAADAKVVKDSVRGEVILLEGGFPNVAASRLHNDNWQLLGTSAQRMSIGEVAFDVRRGRTVIVQPFDSLDTTEWDGIAFGPSALPAGQFVSPNATAMSYSSARDETILVADIANGLQTFRHTADAAPTATEFGNACGLSTTLQLAAGSQPQPGTSHILEATTTSPALALSVLGLSHVATGGVPLPQPLPIGSPTCQLLVDPSAVSFLGSGTQFSHLISIPNSSLLLAERYNAQVIALDGAGGLGTSSGLELQIGEPLAEHQLTETFTNAANRDALTSGDLWGGGGTLSALVGGDGRHGSFSVDLGTALGSDIYEFNTDSTLIPASNTLNNVDELVTNGRFYFTDFVVPANATVRFVGTNPVQLFVRGQANVMGTVSVDAADMPSQTATTGPALGQQVSTFNALSSLLGQAGGQAGPGGNRGGNGGDRGTNLGPTIVGGVNITNGQPGDDVRISAGHAYLGSAIGTGGKGSALTPLTGIWAQPTPTVGGIVYCAYFSPGGSGGGFDTPGGIAASPMYVGTGTGSVAAGASVPGGIAFPVSTYPPAPPAGYSSLEHYSVGGSGGGGGGSHGYGLLAIVNPAQKWFAGHAGTGGGGALAIRAGSNIDIPGELSSRGGDGVIINGGAMGVSSPGGGGSGGSVLLQGSLITVNGNIDTSGGTGSEVGYIANFLQAMTAHAGDGAPGNLRFEAWNVQVQGTTTPTYQQFQHRGIVDDRDALTGSRSNWMRPASATLPIYLRYELLVEVDGLPVLYSDDPTISPLAANNPSGFVMLRFQGAQTDAITGNAIPGTEGPWRRNITGANSLNADRSQTVRFDLVTNTSAVTTLKVLDLRIVWR